MGHAFVKQNLEETYRPQHDPKFLDRDYENISEVGDYTEEDDLDYESMEKGDLDDLERRENESMGIDNIKDRDYKDQDYEKEESTRTGHAFVKQNLEETYRPQHDPEFLDRDYENNSEVGDYTEEDDLDYEG